MGDDRRPDGRNIGAAYGRPRAAHHRALQSLLGLPQRTFRQVLFLGRHAPHGLRYDRQIPDRRADAVPQHLGDQGDRSRYFLPHARAAAHPFVLVLVRRAGRPFGGETPFPGDLEDPRPHLPPLPGASLVARHRLQRHGAARRRRPHPRGRVRLPRAPALCRGGVQRPFRVREAPFRVPRHGGRNRFLLGLRLLL